MSGPGTTHKRRVSRDIGMGTEAGFDFELHYSLSCETTRDVLREILEDISSNKNIHNWDEKLLTTPLQSLIKAGRRYYISTTLDLNDLLDHSMVEEILTVSGFNHRPPTTQMTGVIESYLFFSKVGSHSYDRLY